MGGDARRLRSITAGLPPAHVYPLFGHLCADCRGPASALEPYARFEPLAVARQGPEGGLTREKIKAVPRLAK